MFFLGLDFFKKMSADNLQRNEMKQLKNSGFCSIRLSFDSSGVFD